MEFPLYAKALAHGLLWTVAAFLAALAGTLLIGLCGALASFLRVPWVRPVISTYTTIFRGVPELIIVLGIYYGSALAIGDVLKLLGVETFYQPPAFLLGVVALSLTFGAYAVEIFRAAGRAVPKGDIDAAYSLGMPRGLVYGRIVLPQMARYALPGLGNLALVLLKDTSLLSLIGVAELMRETRVIISVTKAPFTFYAAAALLYLLLTTAALAGVRQLEKHAFRGWPAAQPCHSLF